MKKIFLINEQKCVCHVHGYQCNIMMSDLNIFLQDECFYSKLGLEVKTCQVQSKNIGISVLADLSLASLCQSRAGIISIFT